MNIIISKLIWDVVMHWIYIGLVVSQTFFISIENMALGIKGDMLIIYTKFITFPHKSISASSKVLSAGLQRILC
ncbi:MAG: hypothetical protein V7L01_28390 [Nostoc sp.]|uniref:hypothetical protein n=1 Tax=Nostoc sp. TaxID=1180 RepID=UPI002FF69339